MESIRIFSAKILDTRSCDAFVSILTCFNDITGDRSINICITQQSMTFFAKEEPSNLCKMVATIPVDCFKDYRLVAPGAPELLTFEIPDFKSWLSVIETYKGKSAN